MIRADPCPVSALTLEKEETYMWRQEKVCVSWVLENQCNQANKRRAPCAGAQRGGGLYRTPQEPDNVLSGRSTRGPGKAEVGALRPNTGLGNLWALYSSPKELCFSWGNEDPGTIPEQVFSSTWLPLVREEEGTEGEKV